VLASFFLYSCREKSSNRAPGLTLFRVTACVSSKPSRTGRLVAASNSSMCISQRRPKPSFAPGAVSAPHGGSIRVIMYKVGMCPSMAALLFILSVDSRICPWRRTSGDCWRESLDVVDDRRVRLGILLQSPSAWCG
jgi:hypothetical protein